MISPASQTLEHPADDAVVVEALDAMFRLPSFATPRGVDATPDASTLASRPAEQTTLSEHVALALFAVLAVASVVLVVVSFAD